MSRMKSTYSLLTAGGALAFLLGCSDQPQALSPAPLFNVSLPTSYSVVDISSGPNDKSHAEGINDAGVVVGWSNTPTGVHAWWRNRNRVVWLREPAGATGSEAWAVSNNGSISGTVIYAGEISQPAFWRGPHTMPRLISLPAGSLNGDGLGVNNLRQVVGDYSDAANLNHAFFWSAATGVTTTLGTLGGSTSGATDINDQGQVSGCAELATGETHAYRWTSATGMVDLEPFYLASCAYGINAGGDASGFISTAFADSAAVFLAAGFTRRFLGAGATQPFLLDLNDSLISVGLWTVGGVSVAIAADEFGNSTTLPTFPGATGTVATAINTCGRIVGRTSGATHALLWIPPGC